MSIVRKAPFLSLALICIGVFSVAAKPTDDDPRTSWPLSVPPETLVTIKSDFGKFRVPIGYLNERFSFRQNEFARSQGVAKFDVGDEQAWPAFTFNFWVPDGGRVWDSQPQVETDRPIEPGHPARRIQDFVVLMMYAESAHKKDFRREALDVLPAEFGKPIKAETGDPKAFAYEGAIRDPPHDGYLRYYVKCRQLPLCDGWMVIDHRDMAMRVTVPADGITAMFDALTIADHLLDTWQVPNQPDLIAPTPPPH